MSNRALNTFLIISFGIFGLTALIFQIVFAKNLVLLFGLTAPAVSTVLAVFFFGLALGSLIFGRIADKLSLYKIHWFYISFFVATGIYGFLFPILFKLLNILILSINNVYPLNFAGFNFVAFLLAFIFLAPPAILFGAGFPVVNKILIRREEEVGQKVSLLYFINTFGSVLGALFAGFWLIPSFGNNATIVSAAILNILVAGILFLLFKSSISFANKASKFREQSERVSLPKGANIQHPIFLYVLFITGFLALALEVLYTKTLILFIGSSTYAFSLILITFLLGIALGSWALSFFADRLQRPQVYFGLFLGLIGFWLFLTMIFFEKLPFWYLKIFQAFQSFEFSAIISTQFFLTFLVIFPATFLMGVIFPLGIKLATPSLQKLGSGIGKLYFVNTFGGVLGSLTAGFYLLPLFGFQKSFIFIIVVYFVLAVFFVLKEKEMDSPIKAVLAVLLILFGAFSIVSRSWSPKILASGPSVYAREYLGFMSEAGEQELARGILSDKFLFYKEGLSQVAVVQRGEEVFLRINGKTDASNTMGDLEHEILTGALPLLLHSDPKDILMIGLGSGISLGSVTQFEEPEKIEMVEIDPAVVAAAKLFKPYNNDALNDLRVKVIAADGRNYLYLSDKKYDVISSQPSNLWVSGNAYLFTKEYYELAKSRLKENGLMLQWIQLYGLSAKDISTILKTFGEVFPGIYLFSNVNHTDIFLVGSLKEDALLDFNEIEKKFQNENVQYELSRIHIYDIYGLLAYFVAANEEIRELVGTAKIHTDNRPFLEFSSPREIYKEVDKESSANILKLREKMLDKYAEVVKNLNPEHKEYFENNLIFRQKIIQVILALKAGNLDKALEFYKEAQKTGIVNLILDERMMRACRVVTEIVRAEQGDEAAEQQWQKCQAVLNENVIELKLK